MTELNTLGIAENTLEEDGLADRLLLRSTHEAMTAVHKNCQSAIAMGRS